MVTLLCCFLFWTLSTLEASQGSSIISFSPNSPLCIGEEVETVCFVQSTEPFALNTVQVTINSSADAFSIAELNTDAIIDGIDLSLYRANIDGLSISTSRPGIRVIIRSYQPSDSNTTFHCQGLFPNASLSAALASGQPMQPAAPPSATSLKSNVSHLNSMNRSDDISLTWNTPHSDRSVEYFLYLDGSPLATTNSNNYTHKDTRETDRDYEYSIIAMSCAGNSTTSSIKITYVATVQPGNGSLQGGTLPYWGIILICIFIVCPPSVFGVIFCIFIIYFCFFKERKYCEEYKEPRGSKS